MFRIRFYINPEKSLIHFKKDFYHLAVFKGERVNRKSILQFDDEHMKTCQTFGFGLEQHIIYGTRSKNLTTKKWESWDYKLNYLHMLWEFVLYTHAQWPLNSF